MQRRSFIRYSGLSAGLMALSSKQLLAAILQQPAWKIKMLRGDIGIFTERGGTIGFYQGKDGYTVVDSQFPDQSQHLIDELTRMDKRPFEFLINTHHHGDHTGGNISFKDKVGHVVGHENCLANYKRVSETNKNVDKQLFQDITFSKGWKQKTGKEKIRAYYFGPAHTNGDAIIHFEKANIAHMGDLMFNELPPVIDRSAGASISHWVQVLQQARKTFDNDTIFIFGHAGDPEKVTGSKQEIMAFEDYLQKLLDFVDAQIKAGKTRDEIVKVKDIPGVAWKNSGAERSLGPAYDELTSK
ncbi:MAG: MBL fold metallo-hydrolase [Chitinophagaceae bacterium]|nr:MBL fold metallo-hydrolase [Chitinophagaceae bacterium]